MAHKLLEQLLIVTEGWRYRAGMRSQTVVVGHSAGISRSKRTTVERSEERRKYQRLNLAVPLHITGEDAAGRKLEESSVTVNVSARGAYFTSQTPFKAPMELDVSMSVPYSVWRKLPLPRLEAPAKVVRVDTPSLHGPGDPDKWGVAVRFEEALSARFETSEDVEQKPF